MYKRQALDYAVTITDIGKIKAGINDDNIKHILSLNDEELKAANARDVYKRQSLFDPGASQRGR